MAAIVAQNPLVIFRLPCGKVSRDSPLNMAKIGIASAKRSISNPQKFLPLANVPLESQALGDPKGRDQASLDLLAAFSGNGQGAHLSFLLGSVRWSCRIFL
jgi:hypothetical protein